MLTSLIGVVSTAVVLFLSAVAVGVNDSEWDFRPPLCLLGVASSTGGLPPPSLSWSICQRSRESRTCLDWVAVSHNCVGDATQLPSIHSTSLRCWTQFPAVLRKKKTNSNNHKIKTNLMWKCSNKQIKTTIIGRCCRVSSNYLHWRCWAAGVPHILHFPCIVTCSRSSPPPPVSHNWLSEFLVLNGKQILFLYASQTSFPLSLSVGLGLFRLLTMSQKRI